MTTQQKFVSSTGQLDTSSLNTNNNGSHLVSIFGGAQGNIMMQNQIKVSKIKPGKASIKEKEQLYEDAIKLKIQANSYKEENVKLKTKIKILENEMAK